MFPGLDVSLWDSHLLWLWKWSNLRYVGFYLAHLRGQTSTTWTTHWQDLRDMGWGLLPIWLPFGDKEISQMATANGTNHGQAAVDCARAAKLEAEAVIYLDIESQVFGGPNDAGYANYVHNWMQAVHDGGYRPGVYCSCLDAHRLLTDQQFRAQRLAVWPFSVAGNTANWDNTHFQLTPNVPADWLVYRDGRPVGGGSWPTATDTVCCQFDQWHPPQLLHWPDANGRTDDRTEGSRDVDWDMAKVFEPSHPWAAAVVVLTGDRDNTDWVRIYGVHVGVLDYLERDATGRFSPGQNLKYDPGDIGPTPKPAVNGFDPLSAAAVSRRHSCIDLYLLGQDGYLRTLWANERETYPKHPWPLNPNTLARRGSAIAAVSRSLDQIDVFYVGRDHHLVTQWWNPGSVEWSSNLRVLNGPPVAPSSNVAALPTPNDGIGSSDRLDVLYITLDLTRPYTDPHWDDAWQVVHGVWSHDSDWQLTPIRGLTGVAGSSGVALVRDGNGILHAVVQNRNRMGLQHALMQADATTWNVQAGPGPPPPQQNRPSWWMSLHLIVLADLVLLVGMTNAASLAWSTYTDEHWSGVDQGDAAFATNRPLALARRGRAAVDVVGITEEGDIATRSLSIGQDRRVHLLPANL